MAPHADSRILGDEWRFVCVDAARIAKTREHSGNKARKWPDSRGFCFPQVAAGRIIALRLGARTMGFEGQFSESFAGWSQEVRSGRSLARANEEVLERQSRGPLIPNIVKYRLLPGTAVVAIALTAPGFSQGAGDLKEQPIAAPDPIAFAQPAGFAEAAQASPVQISQGLGGFGAEPIEVLQTPVVEATLSLAAQPTELVALPIVPESTVARLEPTVSRTSFAAAFEPFAGSDESIGDAAIVAVPEAVEVTSVVPPELAEVPAGHSDNVVLETSQAVTQIVTIPAPQLAKVELPISALSTGRIPQIELAGVDVEPVALPLVEIAPTIGNDEMSGSADIDAVEPVEQAEVVAPVSEFAIRPAPAEPIVAPRVSARKPVVDLATPVSRAAVAPQISALPPTRSSGARNDAMPIVVDRAQAIPAPAVQAPVPSAKAGFASAVDPRRPASLPVSGSVSGFDLNIQSQLITRIDGQVAGQLDFKQTNNALAVRLGSIVELLHDRYDMSEFERITASSASDLFVTMSQLRGAGIPITYDPVYDEFNVGTRDHRPSAAHKVQIDQIGSPQRSTERSGIDQVRP